MQWCAISWISFVLGFFGLPFQHPAVVIACGVLAMAGLIFSLIAMFLAFLGVLFFRGAHIYQIRFMVLQGF